jgi:hypothetical protein
MPGMARSNIEICKGREVCATQSPKALCALYRNAPASLAFVIARAKPEAIQRRIFKRGEQSWIAAAASHSLAMTVQNKLPLPEAV